MTFPELSRETEAYLAANPQAQQVVSVWTARGNLRQFFSRHVTEGDYSEENAFLTVLRVLGDTRVEMLVCNFQGHGGWPEVPSYHLRQGLVELNPANADTLILLQSEVGPVPKRLGAMMKPSL